MLPREVGLGVVGASWTDSTCYWACAGQLPLAACQGQLPIVLQSRCQKSVCCMLLSRPRAYQCFLEGGPINPKFAPYTLTNLQVGCQDWIVKIYGSNDAPLTWWHAFDSEVKSGNWQRSQFDSCRYYLYEPQQEGQPPKLCGILGAHVDDTLLSGGHGPTYKAASARLKARFPYRKWRQGNREFCGLTCSQDPKTMEIL